MCARRLGTCARRLGIIAQLVDLSERIMPIYTYKCASCGFAQDEMQKMSDALLTVCPSCGKADYAKQVTAAGFALKGTGWYATDFKGSGSKPAAAKPDAPPPASGTGAGPAGEGRVP